MGQTASRFANILPQAFTEINNIRRNNLETYRYIPSFGSYFTNYFFLGGGRYENIPPEYFLFGENSDLNFLSSKPVPFPYPTAFAHEPTKALRALINIRKDTIKLIRIDASDSDDAAYNLEFIYDIEVPCNISIELFCREENTSDGLKYNSQRPELGTQVLNCLPAKGQLFQQPNYLIRPNNLCNESWQINPLDVHKDSVFPFVISVTTASENSEFQQQSTLCTLDSYSEGGHFVKVLKQKCYIDGVCYILQEIYGLENKGSCLDDIISPKQTATTGPVVLEVDVNGDLVQETALDKPGAAEEEDTSNSDCVVCMCEPRDTLILPCRHLSLCADCAKSLRFQSNNCPICRAPFRALLQLKGLHRTDEIPKEPDMNDVSPNSDTSIGERTSAVQPVSPAELHSRLLETEDSDALASVQVLSAQDLGHPEAEDLEEVEVPSGFKALPIISSLKQQQSGGGASALKTSDENTGEMGDIQGSTNRLNSRTSKVENNPSSGKIPNIQLVPIENLDDTSLNLCMDVEEETSDVDERRTSHTRKPGVFASNNLSMQQAVACDSASSSASSGCNLLSKAASPSSLIITKKPSKEDDASSIESLCNSSVE